jgi:hypothetical protein
MTTEAPNQPAPAPQQPPPPVYPTAPPWAPPPPAEAPQPAGPPWGNEPYTQHGRLMVAHPELMNRAARPKPPSWIPVVPATFFLGVAGAAGFFVLGVRTVGAAGILIGFAGGALGLLGAASAARRAGKARRTGNARYPYWVAFAATCVLGPIVAGLAVAGTVPVYLHFRQSATTKSLQSNLVHDGKVQTPAGTTVRQAGCVQTPDPGTDGLDAYTCTLTLSNGKNEVLRVRTDAQGHWKIAK